MAELKKTAGVKVTSTVAPVKSESVKQETVKVEPDKKETPVKKAAPVKKAPAKKAPAKKVAKKPAAAKKEALVENFYVQYAGKDLEKENIIERCKLSYKEAGNKAAVKSMDIYVKPEENKVYYVINGVAGSIEI